MKTKLEILAKLLQDKVITVEEFVVLSEKEKEYIYYPAQPYLQPYYKPYDVWCSNNGFSPKEITITNTTGNFANSASLTIK